MRGNLLCMLALYGCIPLVLWLFTKYRARDAVLISLFGSVMFLPMDKLAIPLIMYNKITATSIGVLIAIKMYDSQKLESFSLKTVDLPWVFWIGSGFIASILNGLGPKDGIQECFNTFTVWGVAYLAGRFYFSDPEGMRAFCRAIFAAGLIYIPFCLFELKMSPQLHAMVYGYMQHDFSQVMRGDGYRPMVFMEHGLMLGFLMAMASMVGLWCLYSGVFPKKMWGVPTWILVVMLLVVTIACKSSGATGLLLLGLLALYLSTKLKTGILVVILLLVPPAYIGTRATGYWDGQNVVDLISDTFSEDRAGSLRFRFDNENILVEKAQEKPMFGWGGWGRSRVYDEDGEDISVTDGFWIITLGTRGYFGLFSVTAVLLLPMLMFYRMCPVRLWSNPKFAPAAVLSLIPLLFLIDCLLNAMVNFIYIAICGGVSGMLATYGIRKLEGGAVEPAGDAGPSPARGPAPGLPDPQPSGAYVSFAEGEGETRVGRRGIRPLQKDDTYATLGAPSPVRRGQGTRFISADPEETAADLTAAGEDPRSLAEPGKRAGGSLNPVRPGKLRMFRGLGSGTVRNLTDPGRQVRMKPTAEEPQAEGSRKGYMFGEDQWVRWVQEAGG